MRKIVAGAPTVVCIRGDSGAGKTVLAESLVAALTDRGLRVGFLKRSHHELDTNGKDSQRLARAGAVAVLVRGAGGTTVFHQPDDNLDRLLRLLPPDLDLALLETFRPERFPTVLIGEAEAVGREKVLMHVPAAPFPPATVRLVLDRILSLCRARAYALDEPSTPLVHHCAGAVLGRRLAHLGASLLELEIPRDDRRLLIVCENDGCAADAITAATGCRPGMRTLRFRYFGKLAATFTDAGTGRAVRVAARGDLRTEAARLYPECDRHLGQLLSYAELPEGRLFSFAWCAPGELPAARPPHLICTGCTEEVGGDAAVAIDGITYCRVCAPSVVSAEALTEGGLP